MQPHLTVDVLFVNTSFCSIAFVYNSYQAKKHCLELTMPAVFEAYEETVKARSTAGRHLMQVDVGDVLLSG